MSVFREAAKLLNIKEVAIWLGLQVKQGYALCPFHREQTPSLKLYEHSFHCFGCGAHGDSINLTSEVLGITPFEALKALNREFQLSLNFCGKPTEIRRKKGKKPQKEIQEWYIQSLDMLANFVREHILIENIADKVSRAENLHQELLGLSPEVAYLSYQEEVKVYEKYREKEEKLTELANHGRVTINSVRDVLGRTGTV